MNWLFLTQPPDEPAQNAYVTASRSKEFARAQIDTARDDLRRAETRLNDAHEKHDEDTFDGARVICKAEENLIAAQGQLESALVKYRWECNDGWKATFPRTAAIVAKTKALLLRVDWSRLRPKI